MNPIRKNSLESTSAACSAQSQRVSLWNSLERGDEVALTLCGFEFHRGTVEDRTADGRTIWVIDSIGYRRLFHIDDDYDLFIASQS